MLVSGAVTLILLPAITTVMHQRLYPEEQVKGKSDKKVGAHAA
jgi:hypothetical protein